MLNNSISVNPPGSLFGSAKLPIRKTETSSAGGSCALGSVGKICRVYRQAHGQVLLWANWVKKWLFVHEEEVPFVESLIAPIFDVSK